MYTYNCCTIVQLYPFSLKQGCFRAKYTVYSTRKGGETTVRNATQRPDAGLEPGVEQEYRITRHPILPLEPKGEIPIEVDGRTLFAREGETVAAALLANGIRVFRRTAKRHEPRGLFCGIGQCTDCIMEIDGVPNQRTCMTIVRAGMVVNTQEGHGKTEANDR